jgi:hypothetical protein
MQHIISRAITNCSVGQVVPDFHYEESKSLYVALMRISKTRIGKKLYDFLKNVTLRRNRAARLEVV